MSTVEYLEGMSLHDRVAIEVTGAIVSSIDSEENYNRLQSHAAREAMTLSQWIAHEAFKQADAFIAEREKRRAAK